MHQQPLTTNVYIESEIEDYIPCAYSHPLSPLPKPRDSSVQLNPFMVFNRSRIHCTLPICIPRPHVRVLRLA